MSMRPSEQEENVTICDMTDRALRRLNGQPVVNAGVHEASATAKMARREPLFNHKALIDPTPMPDHIPKVKEIGASSAPLMSASYFIGARCKPYNDDYMQCKTEAYGRGELDCLREGRKVTRCAASVLKDINENCLEVFREHWNCLDNNNHQMWQCRRPERRLNRCVFEKLGLEKVIPDTPKGEVPVHLRDRQIFADKRIVVYPWEADVDIPKKDAAAAKAKVS